MPQKKDAQQGKSPSTQAGEFVRDEIEKIRKGEHGARSTKQAIAIGLSEARRSGVKVPPAPKGSKAAAKTSRSAPRKASGESSSTRSKATLKALKREPRSTVSHQALSKQAKKASSKRSAASRHASAMKAARTRKRNEANASHAH